MKIKVILLCNVLLAGLYVPVVLAQSDNSTTDHPATIQQRKKNQQNRIATAFRADSSPQAKRRTWKGKRRT